MGSKIDAFLRKRNHEPSFPKAASFRVRRSNPYLSLGSLKKRKKIK